MVEVKNFHFLKRQFLTKKVDGFLSHLEGGGQSKCDICHKKMGFFFEGFPNYGEFISPKLTRSDYGQVMISFLCYLNLHCCEWSLFLTCEAVIKLAPQVKKYYLNRISAIILIIPYELVLNFSAFS